MERTVVEELNPDLTYRIGKSIPAGDPYCEHILLHRRRSEFVRRRRQSGDSVCNCGVS